MVATWLAGWLWLGGAALPFARLAQDRAAAIGAAALPAPPEFDRRRMIIGFRQYAQACARCHGEPGGSREPWAGGLDPQPSDLTQPGAASNTRDVFWIICHGRKLTGMPAWRSHRSDNDIWDLALFVRALPAVTPEAYAKLRAMYGPAPETFGLTPDATCYDAGKQRTPTDG